MNSGVGFGVFLSNLLALPIPLDEGQPNAKQEMENDDTWRLVITIPALLNIATIIIIYKYYRNPSIISLIVKEDEQSL